MSLDEFGLNSSDESETLLTGPHHTLPQSNGDVAVVSNSNRGVKLMEVDCCGW